MCCRHVGVLETSWNRFRPSWQPYSTPFVIPEVTNSRLGIQELDNLAQDLCETSLQNVHTFPVAVCLCLIWVSNHSSWPRTHDTHWESFCWLGWSLNEAHEAQECLYVMGTFSFIPPMSHFWVGCGKMPWPSLCWISDVEHNRHILYVLIWLGLLEAPIATSLSSVFQ